MNEQTFTRRDIARLAGGASVSGTLPAGASGSEICFMTATELSKKIRRKDLSAREVMAAHLRQIERVNPRVNAIVTLVADQAMEQARKADEALARRERIGPLHGLPVAHKDLTETKGIRATYGSRTYKDHVPGRDSLIVERIRKAGAITVGKTNTPEFGAGSQTFNEVFGATRNPYDTDWMKSCYFISAVGNPAISVPCGFTPEGLPVGLQIVGRHQDEWGILQLAHAFEQATGVSKRRPNVVG